MRIFLTGMPASGKTFWGKKIAQHFDLDFLDLDDCIEKKTAQSIQEIFRLYGESFFRKKEMETLSELVQTNDNFVMATGGGTVCFFDNLNVMKQSGTVIFLQTNIDTLMGRLTSDEKQKRPLLSNLFYQQFYSHLCATLEERKDYYTKSDIILHTDLLDEEGVMNEIKKHL